MPCFVGARRAHRRVHMYHHPLKLPHAPQIFQTNDESIDRRVHGKGLTTRFEKTTRSRRTAFLRNLNQRDRTYGSMSQDDNQEDTKISIKTKAKMLYSTGHSIINRKSGSCGISCFR